MFYTLGPHFAKVSGSGLLSVSVEKLRTGDVVSLLFSRKDSQRAARALLAWLKEKGGRCSKETDHATCQLLTESAADLGSMGSLGEVQIPRLSDHVGQSDERRSWGPLLGYRLCDCVVRRYDSPSVAIILGN